MTKTKRNMKREQRFIKVVSRKMAKAGFECQMIDEHFVISQEGKPFVVDMWETSGWGKRRVHFNLSFAFDGMENVMPEGLIWLVSESNNISRFTTTRLLRDHFTCCVETTVHTAKEFAREFAFATKQIGVAYKNLAANYAKIKKEEFREPEVRRPIGFLAERYMAEVEKLEECKLVALSYHNFAAENK